MSWELYTPLWLLSNITLRSIVIIDKSFCEIITQRILLYPKEERILFVTGKMLLYKENGKDFLGFRVKKSRKRNRLLFINPWIYDFTAYDFWSKPLGILYVAAILRKTGFDIDFIDCMDCLDASTLKQIDKISVKKNIDGRGSFYKEKVSKPEPLKHIPRNYCRYGIGESAFEEKIQHLFQPDAVLITSIMTYWYPGVFKIIELVKKYFPDCPVILGGIYATLCPEHAANFSGADYVLRNNQLNQLLPLLQSLTGNSNNLNDSKNTDFQNLNYYPYPAWDLYQKLDYICLITSRGCPYRCSYCASSVINPELQFRNPYQIGEEIAYWKKIKGVQKFVFYDDALLFEAEKHFIPLLQEIKKRNLNINFYTPNALHARLITPSVAQLMVECGFDKIWLGFETSDPELQCKTGNKIDNSSFVKSIKILLKEGFPPENVRVYLLIGLPEQSLQSITNSVKLVLDNGVRPYLAKYSPIPGTEMWKEIIKEYKWQEPVDPLWHNDALMPYFSPRINIEKYQQVKIMIQGFKL